MAPGPILVVSWFAPPLVSGSAVIVGNLARQFGPHEMVVLGAAAPGCPQAAWPPDAARLQSVGTEWPSSRRGARLWRRVQLPYFVLRAAYLARRVRARAVVAVFPSGGSLLAGSVAAWAAQAPLLPYMHNCYVENRRGPWAPVARWVQNHVFCRAAHVFVMSDGMLDHYRAQYAALSSSALVHSFATALPQPTAPPALHRPLRLALSGTINGSCSDAAGRFAGAISKTADVQLTILSATPPAALRELGLLRGAAQLCTVASDRVIDHLRQADVVLLPHGFDGICSPLEYQTIFPTKTIEYLLCGRPILAHSPPTSFLTRFLRQHRCALVVDTPSVAALVAALDRLRRRPTLRAALVRRAQRAAAQFFGPVVAGHLRARLAQASGSMPVSQHAAR